jgi:hypothetical protein
MNKNWITIELKESELKNPNNIPSGITNNFNKKIEDILCVSCQKYMTLAILFYFYSNLNNVKYQEEESLKERLNRIIDYILPYINGCQYCTEDKLTELRFFLLSNEVVEQFTEYLDIINLRYKINDCKDTHRLIIFKHDTFKNYEELINQYNEKIKKYNNENIIDASCSQKIDDQICDSCQEHISIPCLSLALINSQNDIERYNQYQILDHIIDNAISHIEAVCDHCTKDKYINQLSKKTKTQIISHSNILSARKDIKDQTFRLNEDIQNYNELYGEV